MKPKETITNQNLFKSLAYVEKLSFTRSNESLRVDFFYGIDINVCEQVNTDIHNNLVKIISD